MLLQIPDGLFFILRSAAFVVSQFPFDTGSKLKQFGPFVRCRNVVVLHKVVAYQGGRAVRVGAQLIKEGIAIP
jgi:hypothetical protein